MNNKLEFNSNSLPSVLIEQNDHIYDDKKRTITHEGSTVSGPVKKLRRSPPMEKEDEYDVEVIRVTKKIEKNEDDTESRQIGEEKENDNGEEDEE